VTVVRAGAVVYLTGQLGGSSGRSGISGGLRAYARSAVVPDWSEVGQALTNSRGSATFAVGPLEVTTEFVLRGPRGVESNVVTVKVRDPLGLTVFAPAAHPSKRILVASAPAAYPGDIIRLQRRDRGQWVDVADESLDGRSLASFVVDVSRFSQATDYRAVLVATDRHTFSFSGLLTMAPKASPSPGGPGP
jgi:hypothetical protein